MYNEKSKKATIKYLKSNYSEIRIKVKKEKKKDFKERIIKLGYKSITKFVIAAIEEKLNKEEP